MSPAEQAVAQAGAARDATLRGGETWRERGVVHTPGEVARYTVAAVDRVLRTRLRLPGGIADPRVAIVDPACGPGAFLAAALAVAGRRRSRPGAFVGLDLDETAVSTARQILAPAADDAGWPLVLRVADTLENLDPFAGLVAPPRAGPRVTVVVGNPPWAGRSANRHAATAALLEDFRRDSNGQRLDEKKLGVLSDDYVRFFRWASEVARQGEGGGALALVTNGSYLDGPVHRGMRGALVRWFDGVEVLDLGGSALLARGSAKDENVFGVRPAVAVTVAYGAPALPATHRAQVHYRRMMGTREEKLAQLVQLVESSGAPSSANLVASRAPGYLFKPVAVDAKYESWVPLDTLFSFHAEGVQTNRDAAVIDTDEGRLGARLTAFVAGTADPALDAARRSSRHYDPEKARRRVATVLEGKPSAALRPIAYRPFDYRHFAVVTPFCHRPRPRLLAAMDHGGLALVTVRKDRGDLPWAHFGVVRAIPDNCFLSTRSSCRTRAFPARDPDGAENLDEVAAGRLAQHLSRALAVEEVIFYALAVLASEGYRARFDGLLRLDYPRIPPPPDQSTFDRCVAAGREIAAAFLVGDEVGEGEPVSVGHHVVSSTRLAAAVADASLEVAPLVDGD